MKYSEPKNLGVSLSRLGFGVMRLPQSGGKIDRKATNRMIATAVERGVNYFDTAYVYGGGESERALGEALSGGLRERVFIADKMPIWNVEAEGYFDACFNTSLERLKTDRIDFYLLHSASADTFARAVEKGALEWAERMRAQGKIRFFGFSTHAPYGDFLPMLDQHKWDFVQMQYNYLDEDEDPGHRGYEELVRRGLPIVIMEPLKGGMLTDLPDAITKPFRELGGSNAEYAFRWLGEKPGIATILSGMSAQAQLEENLATFDGLTPLTDAERAAIGRVSASIRAAQKAPCTGCRYCMPCPRGVRIPDLFRGWNNASMWHGGQWINNGDIDFKNAESCVGCGLCAKKCPQKIDIPGKIQALLAERS